MLQIVDSTEEDTDEDEQKNETHNAAATTTSTASLIPPGFVLRASYSIEDYAAIQSSHASLPHASAAPSLSSSHAPAAPPLSTAPSLSAPAAPPLSTVPSLSAPAEPPSPKCSRFRLAKQLREQREQYESAQEQPQIEAEQVEQQQIQVEVPAAKTQKLSKDLPPELPGDAETKQVWDEWHRVREDRKETTVWIGNIRIWYRLRPAPSKEPGDIYIKFPDRKKIRSTKELIEYLSDRLPARSTKPLPSGCSLEVMLKAFNLMEYAAKFEENG